jgi:hypothetical protein
MRGELVAAVTIVLKMPGGMPLDIGSCARGHKHVSASGFTKVGARCREDSRRINVQHDASQLIAASLPMLG